MEPQNTSGNPRTIPQLRGPEYRVLAPLAKRRLVLDLLASSGPVGQVGVLWRDRSLAGRAGDDGAEQVSGPGRSPGGPERSGGPEGLRPGPETCGAPERSGKTTSRREQNDRFPGGVSAKRPVFRVTGFFVSFGRFEPIFRPVILKTEC